jgi:hypothetical protein
VIIYGANGETLYGTDHIWTNELLAFLQDLGFTPDDWYYQYDVYQNPGVQICMRDPDASKIIEEQLAMKALAS